MTPISNTVNPWIRDVESLLQDSGIWIWIGLLVCALASLGYGWIQTARMRRARKEANWARNALTQLNPTHSMDKNLNHLLDLFIAELDAASYGFYLYDSKKEAYLLRTVRNRTDDMGKIRPSYSGLVPYQKEAYRPPFNLARDAVPKEPLVRREGEVPVLIVPLGTEKGALLAAPVFKVGRSRLRLLKRMRSIFDPLLDTISELENTRNESEIIVSSGRAMQKISHMAMDSESILTYVIEMASQSVEADGGFVVERRDGSSTVPVAIGLDEDTLTALRDDPPTLEFMRTKLSDSGRLLRSDQDYYYLPPYLSVLDAEVFTKIDLDDADGRFLILWHSRKTREQEEGFDTSLKKVLSQDVKHIIAYQTTLRKLSDHYFEILKLLARMLDHMSPYTVGNSEMMSRFSAVIARKMGMSDGEISDIASAAYLSNIGVLGLSTDLLHKEGKYSDKEFEMMKLHAEIGASIVRVLTGNDRVADCIHYHHERMDGNGYPEGLAAGQIPVGARIIAVVQTFLAKVNGRPYREPLPFHQALQLLRNSSGSQLDSEIVDHFIEWFKEKQRQPQVAGRALGACWEMCCTPSAICERCPVYQRQDVNCWEVEGNQCASHGKYCNSCFVRTEFFHREEVLRSG